MPPIRGSPPKPDDEGNYTGDAELITVPLHDQRYSQQSAGSGTFAITYNQYGFDGSLAFTAQGRSLAGFGANGLSEYTERVSTLNLRISREMATAFGKYNVFFEGSDLLKGPHDSDLETSIGGAENTPKFYTQGAFIGGRRLSIGVKASF